MGDWVTAASVARVWTSLISVQPYVRPQPVSRLLRLDGEANRSLKPLEVWHFQYQNPGPDGEPVWLRVR
ncbi:MAG: hypothetical protein JWO82_1934 [Akkermansiaceae bacterium]|nr:hypothetical protein [Akkermansiaceae bacterium]